MGRGRDKLDKDGVEESFENHSSKANVDDGFCNGKVRLISWDEEW